MVSVVEADASAGSGAADRRVACTEGPHDMPVRGHLNAPVVKLVRDEDVAGGIEVVFRGTRLTGLSRATATADNYRDQKTYGDQERASDDCHKYAFLFE